MATIVKLAQGSGEWHEHRKSHRNASETPSVLGVSPWVTRYQLWLQRTGRAEQQINPAMRRGSELEPVARRAYEQLTGLVFEPLVLVDGEYSASLDGMTLDGGLILEVKCPVKGKDSDVWQQVQSGLQIAHYYWQVQHQLMVTGAKLAHVWIWDGKQGLLLEQQPEPACWPEIRKAWDAFMELILTDQPPLLTDRDTVERLDPAWQRAAERVINAKRIADRATEELEASKKALITLATHPSERGAGVTVSRYWKAGLVDYKRIPALSAVDLDSFRGPGREEVRVTVAK
jgi:putative phage-type endonuclease